MKCVQLKGKKEFQIGDIPEPISQNGSVIIDVKKAGICGSDIHYWDVGEPVGLVMGHEFCGVVTNPGSREDLKVGDRVTALPISPCGHCEACLTGNPQYCRETWTYATGLSLTNPGALAPKMALRPDMVLKVPDNVKEAASKLCYTSGYTVSIGLKGKVNVPYLWFYVYDEEILFPRVYIASFKSPYNAPEGYSSLQAEIPCSKFKQIKLSNNEIAEHTVNKLTEMKIFDYKQVEFAQLDYNQYGNILFTLDTETNKKIVLDWLKENNIYTAGRYGKWEYYWTDQAINSGFDVVNSIF